MRKYYKVKASNSTVCGDPGRFYDWSKFCWDGSAIHYDRCNHPGCDAEHTKNKAPLPFVDGYLIAKHCQYLHVPYNWEKDCTIFRVRPNDSMWTGERYRGKVVKRQTAEQKDGVWYWVLEF
jgi:hypothetical protein